MHVAASAEAIAAKQQRGSVRAAYLLNEADISLRSRLRFAPAETRGAPYLVRR
jgi:hypothetical protein